MENKLAFAQSFVDAVATGERSARHTAGSRYLKLIQADQLHMKCERTEKNRSQSWNSPA